MNLFIKQLFENPEFFFIQIIIVIFSVCLHEYAHARVALWQGDSTAAKAGHLTLNPMIQMGPMSLFMLALVGLAWGAVPVNPRLMRHPRLSPALTAAAGPFTNLMLAVLFGLLLTAAVLVSGNGEAYPQLYTALQIGILINWALFFLNLCPCYPLDGWGIVSPWLPLHKIQPEIISAVSMGLFIVIFTLSDKLFKLAGLAATLQQEYTIGILQKLLPLAGL